MDVAANIPGLPGLFLAGLVSAGLSTMSASLNTVAGTIYEDFIDPWLPNNSDKEHRAANIMKVHHKITDKIALFYFREIQSDRRNIDMIFQVIVVVVGLICAALVFLVDRLGDIFRVSLTLHGITAGSMLGIFTLGMTVPWATSKGAIAGGLISILFMIWIIVGAQVNMAQKRFYYPPLPTSTEDCINAKNVFNQTKAYNDSFPIVEDKPFILYTISFMYYTLLGFLVSMIVGTAVSFIFGTPDLRDVDRNHFPPIIQRYTFKLNLSKRKKKRKENIFTEARVNFCFRFLPPKKYTEVPMHSIPTALITNPEKEKLNS